jgi:general stress protein YciG
MTREEIARLGGKAIVEQRGRDYMADLGRKGLERAVEADPNFHRKGGEASFRKQQVEAIRRGEFTNQPEGWWRKQDDDDSEIPF